MQACNKKKSLFFALCIQVILHATPNLVHATTRVYFAPDDQPREHLINYIKKAKTRIYAAIYMFTDNKIAQALIEKKKEKLDIQIIFDPCSVDSEWGKIKLLTKQKIRTYAFKPQKHAFFKTYSLMHNKFAIIDNKVWTGSFNWTVSANTRNQENVIVTSSKSVCEKFVQHFAKLKKRCRRYKLVKKKK